MIIRSLHARKFRCLDDATLQFGPGLNIIKGPNEAGKSTVHAALLKVLFERPTTKRANEDDRAWHAEQLYQLTLEFTDTSAKSWRLSKDFERNSASLVSGANTVTTHQAVQDKVSSMIGTSSERVFVSTVCVRQDAIAQIGDGSKEIAQSLEEIVTGGEEDIYSQAAIKKLDDAVRDLRRGHQTFAGKNPGPIAGLTKRKADLAAAVDKLTPIVERRTSAAVRHQEDNARIAEIAGKLALNRSTVEAYQVGQQLQKQLDESRTEEAKIERQLQQLRDAEAARAAAQLALGQEQIASLSEDKIAEIGKLKSRVDVYLERQANERPALVEAGVASAAQVQASTPRRGPVIFLYVAALLGLGAAAVLYFQYPDLLMPALVSAGVGLLCLIVAISMQVRAGSQPEGSVPASAVETGGLTPGDELAAAQAALAASLRGIGCGGWSEYEQRLQTAQHLRTEAAKADVHLSALTSATSSEESLEQQRREVSRKRRDLEERLAEPKIQLALAMKLAEFNEVERETASLEEENVALTDEALRLQYQLGADSDVEADLLRNQDELAAVTADLERLLERLAVYELALRQLTAAREQTLVRASDLLAPRIGEYLPGLTNGRYRSVSVGTNLNIVVSSASVPGGQITPSNLSRGTQDQIYLAARLALVDLLFPDTRPPIFLDDPFVTFDAERRSAALDLCRRIGEQRQVFLFTHANDCDHLGNVIELPVQHGYKVGIG